VQVYSEGRDKSLKFKIHTFLGLESENIRSANKE